MKYLTTTALLLASSTLANAEDLQIETFNPGEASAFAVASSLITGPTEAILIDAQFQKNDAETVLKMVQDSGRELTTIYVSHPDPDFYFGLDVITAAYPDAKVVATQPTIDAIEASIDGKVAFWSPILGENAPTTTVIPNAVESDTLTVDGVEVKIVGLDGENPEHTFVWVPSEQTILGGVLVYENVHVWLADAPTVQERDKWRASLDGMLALNPTRIISGHAVGASPEDTSGIAFTKAYLDKVDAEVPGLTTSEELVQAMTTAYPEFKNLGDLELGAAVVMGERTWP